VVGPILAGVRGPLRHSTGKPTNGNSKKIGKGGLVDAVELVRDLEREEEFHGKGCIEGRTKVLMRAFLE